MSKNTLSAMFKALADILEENSELADALRSELIKRINPEQKKYPEVPGFFDPKVTAFEIRSYLEKKTLEELIWIVQGYALDHTRLMTKQTDKQKVIEFIIGRRDRLLNRYKGFEEDSKAFGDTQKNNKLP